MSLSFFDNAQESLSFLKAGPPAQGDRRLHPTRDQGMVGQNHQVPQVENRTLDAQANEQKQHQVLDFDGAAFHADDLFRFVGVSPAHHFGAAGFFEIFVMGEMMRYLRFPRVS